MEDISNIPTNDYQSDSLNFILHLIPNYVIVIDLQSGFIKFENENFLFWAFLKSPFMIL